MTVLLKQAGCMTVLLKHSRRYKSVCSVSIFFACAGLSAGVCRAGDAHRQRTGEVQRMSEDL